MSDPELKLACLKMALEQRLLDGPAQLARAGEYYAWVSGQGGSTPAKPAKSRTADKP